MKISRAKIKDKMKEASEEANKEPVLITHYNITTTVLISSEVYEALEEEILKKYEELKTK